MLLLQILSIDESTDVLDLSSRYIEKLNPIEPDNNISKSTPDAAINCIQTDGASAVLASLKWTAHSCLVFSVLPCNCFECKTV